MHWACTESEGVGHEGFMIHNSLAPSSYLFPSKTELNHVLPGFTSYLTTEDQNAQNRNCSTKCHQSKRLATEGKQSVRMRSFLRFLPRAISTAFKTALASAREGEYA